jgi:hypothetical protein
MVKDNSDCKLVVEIGADEERDVLMFLDEIRSKVARLDRSGEAYACAGHYRFSYEYPGDAIRPAVLRDLLLLAGVNVSLDAIEMWTNEERLVVEEWAASVYLSASDNDIEVGTRPGFLSD